MFENAETREVWDACAALSPLNQKRAYEVACALKFAEKRPVKDAGMGLSEFPAKVPAGGMAETGG